jgi:anaerobic ribonucleoside-triphosphate reductase activating protein
MKRYAGLNTNDFINGQGTCVSFFVQGCPHHCPECFNQDTWNFFGGKVWTNEVEQKFLDIASSNTIDCVSILGGEPFDQEEITDIIARIKEKTGKPIYVWTGYVFEQLIDKNFYLNDIDYIIDGRYIHELRDPKLWLRGSSNQRVIDVKQSLNSGTIIIHQERYS